MISPTSTFKSARDILLRPAAIDSRSINSTHSASRNGAFLNGSCGGGLDSAVTSPSPSKVAGSEGSTLSHGRYGEAGLVNLEAEFV